MAERSELRPSARESSSWRAVLTFIGTFIGLWGAYAALFITQQVAALRVHGVEVPFLRVVTEVSSEAALWCLLSPLVVVAVGRRRAGRGPWSVLRAALLVLVTEQLGWAWVQRQFPWRAPAPKFADDLVASATQSFAFAVLVVLVIVAVCEARRREREAAAQMIEAGVARLAELTAQLHPHFLFNALSTIASVAHTDAARAERLIAELGDLLRQSLSREAGSTVTLRVELELLARYVAIQTARFGDRLSVLIPTAAAIGALAEVEVPPFALQPLVENAIRHNLEIHAEPLEIEISIVRSGDHLNVIVTDDGVGFREPRTVAVRAERGVPEVASGGSGLGLRNLASRLELLYGGNARLEFADRASGGAEVSLRLPMAARELA
jgi:hypothetical protein